jgi:hydroxymethylbilane synthase
MLLKREAPRLRLGTRGSRLALVQADLACAALLRARPDLAGRIDVVTFTSAGDKDRSRALDAMNDQGGRGLFSDTLDAALKQGAIDLAVHSVKDLPPVLPRGLVLAATLERADPREAFVSFRHRRLADAPAKAVFGTASHRRETLLRAIHPDAEFALLRGNVEERIAALKGSALDGTILAVAGLARLGRSDVIAEILPPDVLMPDPGQGAIGLVCRTDDVRLRRVLAIVDHRPTHAAVDAERAVLAAVGTCRPLGALARIGNDSLVLEAVLAPEGGGPLLRGRIDGPLDRPDFLGRVLGLQLAAGLDRIAA